jgi:hypothetical protein
MMPGPLYRDRARIVFDCRMANDPGATPHLSAQGTALKSHMQITAGRANFGSLIGINKPSNLQQEK